MAVPRLKQVAVLVGFLFAVRFGVNIMLSTSFIAQSGTSTCFKFYDFLTSLKLNCSQIFK